jgi:prevent-host-death family protein
MKSVWQVQEAKAELSALIKAAQAGPQIITRHGTAVAVLLSYTEYQQLQGRNERPSLLDFFRTWPELEVPQRDRSDFGRTVKF